MLKENISRKGFKDLSRRAMSRDREVKASSGGPLEAVLIATLPTERNVTPILLGLLENLEELASWGGGLSTAKPYHEAASGERQFCTLLHVHSSFSQG